VNVTLSETLCPAGTLKGRLTLDAVYSLPRTFIVETFTLVDPLFRNTINWVSFCPSGTLPNATEEGDAVNCCAAACGHKGSSIANAPKMVTERKQLQKG
jgi:hypothetical protein